MKFSESAANKNSPSEGAPLKNSPARAFLRFMRFDCKSTLQALNLNFLVISSFLVLPVAILIGTDGKAQGSGENQPFLVENTNEVFRIQTLRPLLQPTALPMQGGALTSFPPVNIHVSVPAGTVDRTLAVTYSGILLNTNDVVDITVSGTASGGPGFPFRDANGVAGVPVSGGVFPAIVQGTANIYSIVGAIRDTNAPPSSVISDNHWFAIGTNLTSFVPPKAGELCFVFDDALYRSDTVWANAYADNTGVFTANVTKHESVQIRVDANRDGEIQFEDETDKTTAAKPFRFWLNDDRDKPKFLPEFILTVPEWESSEKDSDPVNGKDIIETTRDLEDFAQIAIKADEKIKDKIINQNYKLAIQATGGLQVNVFKATQAGAGYLFDQNVAANQVAGTYTVASGQKKYGEVVDLNDLSASIRPEEYGDTPIPFLFEGKTGGTGTIKLVLKKPDDTVETSSEVHVKLMSIKEMYERARATPEDGFVPPYDSGYQSPAVGFASQTPSVQSAPPSDESKECIVFVHGWNLTLWECENWAETMYKRLWWQGYKGRFAAFRWTPYFAGATGNDFNASEHRAFKYGMSLKAYIDNPQNGLKARIPGYTINIAAHSQGNIVTSEALFQGMALDNYVLMQAAVPANCYDRDEALGIEKFIKEEKSHPTPDLAVGLGYRSYFQNVSGKLINFYNPVDFALVRGTILGKQANWENNNLVNKPFNPDGGGKYKYDQKTGRSEFKKRIITDPHESMAMVARSRTKAVGAEGRTAGKLVPTESVDLRASFGFTDTRLDHDAQFYNNIQQNMKAFYKKLMEKFQIPSNP